MFATAAEAGENAGMVRLPVVAFVSLLVSALALAVALGSEHWGGLVPCALCLVERWPWRVAALLSAAAMIPVGRTWPRVLPRLLLWCVVACMAASVALAGLHVGVEAGWWPSPLPECAAPNLGSGSIADRLARMPAHPSKPCDAPTYLVPGVPVSMAAGNGLLALVLGAFLLISLPRLPKDDADARPLPAR